MGEVGRASRLIITVHGIRTFGHWQERLEGLLRERDPSVSVQHYKYGYFSSVAFMLPFLRWWVTQRFRRELAAACAAKEWDRVDVVAHSFGTHLVGWGLKGIRSGDRPRIHTVLLAGSVLKPSFPWQELTNGCVGRVVNDCGTKDGILVLNQAVALFTGMAGRVGFAGMSHDRFRNRYFPHGHSGYFVRGGRSDDEFMRTWWLPVLLTDDAPAVPEDPRDSSVVQGLVAFALNNAEPLKIALWLAPFVYLTVLFFGLYREADARRAEARRRLVALQVASGERRSDEGDLAASLLWYAAALESSGERADGPDERDQRVRIGTALRRHPVLLRAVFESAQTAAISADGALLAIAGGRSGDGRALVVDVATGERVRPVVEEPVALLSISFSADGSVLAAICDDGTARAWDPRTGTPVCPPMRHEGRLSLLRFGPDGRLLTVCDDGDPEHTHRADLWDLRTGTRTGRTMSGTGWIGDAAFRADGARVALIAEGVAAQVWDAASGQALGARIDCGEGRLSFGTRFGVGFSPNGERFATSNGERIDVWDAHTGGRIAGPWELPSCAHVEFVDDQIVLGVTGTGVTKHWHLESSSESGKELEHGGGRFAATSAPRSVGSLSRSMVVNDLSGVARVWSTTSATPLTPPLRNIGAIRFTCISADGSRVVLVDEAGVVRVWGLGPPAALLLEPSTPFQSAAVRSAAFSPDGTRVLSVAPEAGAAYLWSAETGEGLLEFRHSGAVECASFSGDGSRVLTAGKDGFARVWDARTGEPVGEPLPHGDRVLVASFSSGGDRIVTGCERGTAHVWDVGNAREVFPPIDHAERIVAARFVDDDRSVLVAGGASARLYDAGTGEKSTAGPRQNEEGLLAASIDPSGRRIASGGMDGIARIWDARTGEPLTPPLDHSGGAWRASFSQRIEHCEFSPDGTLLATAGGGGTTRIWNATTGALAAPWLFDSEAFATFSPDGRWIATAGYSGGVRVWAVDTGEALTPPFTHDDAATTVAFDSTGGRLVSASLDGTVRVWDLSPDGRPVGLLRTLAEVTACRRIDDVGGLVDLTLEELRGRWESLSSRDAGPSDAPGAGPPRDR